jgi:hypothetical protein
MTPAFFDRENFRRKKTEQNSTPPHWLCPGLDGWGFGGFTEEKLRKKPSGI